MIFKRLLLLIMLLTIPGLASGEGNIRVGKMEIHPYFLVKETYSDNIYATSTDQKHDYITTLVPGLRLLFPFREHQLGAEYNRIFTKYSKYHHENTTDENASAFADFKFGNRLGLKVADVFAKGHEPRGSSSTGFIEKFHTNAASASVTYKLADVSKVQLDYTRSAWSFKTSQFRDRDEDLIAAYVFYRLMPKTSAFIEYDYKIINFEQKTEDLDNKVSSGLLGIAWDITEKSKGSVKGGYLWKNFESRAKRDFRSWVASVDLNHEFSDHTALKIIGQRVVNETSLSGIRYTVTTGIYAEFTHKFTYKISGILRGSYGQDKYSNPVAGDARVRKDRTTGLGGGVKYAMRDWLVFSLDYHYRNRNSNIDVNDYRENAYFLTVNFAL